MHILKEDNTLLIVQHSSFCALWAEIEKKADSTLLLLYLLNLKGESRETSQVQAVTERSLGTSQQSLLTFCHLTLFYSFIPVYESDNSDKLRN